MHRWAEALESLATRPEEALALEVSVPFCVWQCLCCNREVEAGLDRDSMARYVDAVIDEMSLVADTLGRGHDVLQVHFGGGSPNHLECEQIERLVQALHQRFRIPAEAEWSIGCDPRRCSATQMDPLYRLGFRQLRFGQADTDPTVQAAAGRLQSAALLADVMQLAREAHFRCLQLELVCGLPGQTPERWQATLQTRRWPLAAVHDPDPAERRRRQGSEMLRCRGVLPAEVLDAGCAPISCARPAMRRSRACRACP
jgi:oxygen-independent coproporphyrinogen-3 oxidase